MRRSVRNSTLPTLCVAFALLSVGNSPLTADEETNLPHYIGSFFKRYCIDCHGPSRQESELRIDQLTQTGLRSSEYQKWLDIRNQLVSGDMPPPNESRPADAVFRDVAAWITSELAAIRPATSRNSENIVARRLNRAQYNNTVRDLLGASIQPADKFPADTPAFGFTNNGSALSVTPLHFENYLSAATRLIDRVVETKPQPIERAFRFQAERPGRIPFQQDRSRLMGNITLRGKAREEDAILYADRKYGDALIIQRIPLTKAGRYFVRVRVAAQTVPNHGPPRLRIITEKRVAFEEDITSGDLHTIEQEVYFPAGDVEVRLINGYQVPMTIDNMRARSLKELEQPKLVVDYVEVIGPKYDVWPPRQHQLICFPSPNGNNERIYSREVISKFMARAFRRPVARHEVELFARLYDQERPHTQTFYEAIKVPLVAILASPDFLYLIEKGTHRPQDEPTTRTDTNTTAGSQPLNDYELANRLSYFLWNTMPDNHLFHLAHTGQLSRPEILRATVERMLRDDRHRHFTANFVGEWLGTDSLGQVRPDTKRFPHYDLHLEQSLVRQTEALFHEILVKDLSAMNLLDPDFIMVNERLARFYGIANVRGDEFRSVPLARRDQRGGLLTHGSILTLTSNGTRTSPVKRGVWILDKLLDAPPPPPPANAGDLESDVPSIGKTTVKLRLAKHRENTACASCHAGIDPLGFALENYNAVGQWRTHERDGFLVRPSKNDPVIDSTGTLPNGQTIRGMNELREYLVAQDDRFTRTIVRKLLTYALGRGLASRDAELINQLHQDFRESGDRIGSLIHAITQTEEFRSK